MAAKFKKGDRVQIAKTSGYYNAKALKNDSNPNVGGTITSVWAGTLGILVDWDNREQNSYNEEDLITFKTEKMATKKKTGGIQPKDGMYFTATRNRKKIRGVIADVSGGIYNDWMFIQLEGKDFDDDNEDGDFPTRADIEYDNTESTFEEALRTELNINNFTVCTDKRQKAVIDGDKNPFFGEWRVRLEDGNLVFGCGKVQVSPKDARTFVEIFCDYGEPDTIQEYQCVVKEIEEDGSADSNDIEGYYQVRKYLEENYTAAQIDVFNDVLKQIDNSNEQNIKHLECSEMKALLAKF